MKIKKKYYKDEELIIILKNFYEKNGFPKRTYFKTKNDLPDHLVYTNRFGSWVNALALAGIEIPKEKSRLLTNHRNTSNEELLIIMKENYNNTSIFPKQSYYSSKNGLPSYSVYVNRFGTFQNAIIESGIIIPDCEMWKFDKFFKCTDEELLDYLKVETDRHLENNLFLLTQELIDLNKNMPSASSYQRRFGGIKNAYKRLNIDCDEFNKINLEDDMITKLIKLNALLGRTPNSRDIDKYSKLHDGYYSMKTYEQHFGSLYNAQIKANLKPTKIGMNKTEDDMLSDLIKLKNELGRVPILREIDLCDYTCSDDYYLMKFGTINHAFKLAGIPECEFNNNNIYYTSNGTKCLSLYELDITQWLEDNDFKFNKEVLYRDVILNDNTLRKFDWVIQHNDNTHYVEMFGVSNNHKYDEKTKGKIRTCKDNNINLIEIYPKDLKEKSLEEIFSFLYN